MSVAARLVGRAVPLALVLMLVAGCNMLDMFGGGEEQESGAAAVAPTAPTAAVVDEEDAEDSESGERYSYNSIGKRDPFRSFIQKEVVVMGGEGPLGPLQLHEIDMYRLRGIVWNVQDPRGLVEDPDGVGHVVKLGDLVGKNWGKVTQIKPAEIIITEEYRDPIENELIINEVTMRLPDPVESKKD